MEPKVKKALNLLKAKLVEHFGPQTEIYLFGSAARGDYHQFSDVDVLALLPCEVDISLEESVFDLAFEVGLQYDIVFGMIVYSIDFWSTPMAEAMSFHENIKAEGIVI